MHAWKWKILIVALVSTALAVPGSAVAEWSADGNKIEQEADDVELELDDAVNNDLDVYIGNSDYDGNAVANCQWLLAVNTVASYSAVLETLGLINDEDSDDDLSFLLAALIGFDDSITRNHMTDESNGTASCEQTIGPVHVHLEDVPGWGEPAPQAAAGLQRLGAAGARTAQCCNGGGGNNVDQDDDIDFELDIDDWIENDAYISIHGDGNAVANCQFLIAWNTAALYDVFWHAEAFINDNDSDDDINGPFLPVENGRLIDFDNSTDDTIDNDFESATATCTQTVESVTLASGDAIKKVPPQS